MNQIKVWKGHDGKVSLQLTQDGSSPTAGAITRAVFAFGGHCLDTDVDQEIQLVNNGQSVQLELGLIESLSVGRYMGYLTIYDAQAVNGIPWGDPVDVIINSWKTCEE